MSPISPLTPQPKRVLMTIDATSEAWRPMLELTRALSPYKIDIALAVTGSPPSELQRNEAAGIPHLEMRLSPFGDDLAKTQEWLLEYEEDYSPDLIHLNGFIHGALPWSVPVMTTTGDDLFSRWYTLQSSPRTASLEQYRARIAAGIRGTDLIVAPSRARFTALCEAYAPAPVRCAPKIVPFACDPSAIPALEKEPYILATGCASNEADNLAILETAAAGIPWPVNLAGETDLESNRLVHLRPLGPLTGADLACRLGRAAIFVRPSQYEPFGLSILEAGYAGCALVISDTPALRETWGNAAIYLPPDDPVALRKVISRLISERAFRLEMSTRARARARQFTPTRMAEGYFEGYRELLSRSAQPLAIHLSS